jgi:hypothetical protein
MENDTVTRDTTIRAYERYEDHEYRWFAFLLILVLVGVAGH